MSVTKTATEEIVEQFDEVFGVDYSQRDGNEYDMSEGMVQSSANTTAIVFNPEDMEDRFGPVHDMMDTEPKIMEIGGPDDDYTTFKVDDVESVMQSKYLEETAELFGWDSVSRKDVLMNSDTNTYPVKITKGDHYVMVAPVLDAHKNSLEL